ncbi:Major facilitator superfamily domain, general substrate transporter [Lecanosticta acicola]|uniref:Major facilitator superfamily domain, general substrate transporter n=1 Tax=Lecanosticta acicola TaxID=111012 RepID=A0AAI8W1H2_9PEZI|nr:Major facilitator superfamily domain, general substrate transporter [Lecanosticta acicola]
MRQSSKYASTLGFAGVLFGSLLVAIDAVALAPSLPTLADALNAPSIEIYWAGVAYTLGSATFLPLFPAASSALGRRPVVLAALLLFLTGTIVCGTAHKIAAMLAGRVLQGIGGGGIVGMLYVVIADLFDMRWRPKALSINGLFWLVGTGCGPVIGGGFSAYVSWRWIFWIVLPINGIAIVLVALFLDIPITAANEVQIDRSKAPGLAGKKSIHKLSWKQMDYGGAALLVASLSSFLIPITWGGIQYSWSSWHTLAPLSIGVFGLFAWLAYEAFVPANPIMPLSILSDRTVSIAAVSTFVTGLCQYGVVFYLPLYFQIVKGYSPLISGLGILPSTLSGAPSNILTGVIISKTGRYKLVVLIAWAILAMGMGVLTLLDRDTSVLVWIFLGIPGGFGFGMVLPALTVAFTAPVREEHMAIASGLSPYTRAIGQSIGIAVGNSMVQNLLKNRLSSSATKVLSANADLISKNMASQDLLNTFMRSAAGKHELLNVYTSAIRDFWWLLCGLALFCGLLSFFIRDVSLDRDSSSVVFEKRSDSVTNLSTYPKSDSSQRRIRSCDDASIVASMASNGSKRVVGPLRDSFVAG